jgi:group I intron endonuclease
MNFLDNDFPEVTEAYHGSLEDWLELFERYAFPVGEETDTSIEMKRYLKYNPEATYEDWLDRVIKFVRDEIWYEEKINLSIRELYLVVNKVARISEKLRATYNKLSNFIVLTEEATETIKDKSKVEDLCVEFLTTLDVKSLFFEETTSAEDFFNEAEQEKISFITNRAATRKNIRTQKNQGNLDDATALYVVYKIDEMLIWLKNNWERLVADAQHFNQKPNLAWLDLTAFTQGSPEGWFGRAGIYCIRNKITGQLYIGQAVNLSKRIKEHINNAKKSGSNVSVEDSPFLHGAILKDSTAAFQVAILEYVNEIDELNDREKYWIADKQYNTYLNLFGYNLTPGGNSYHDLDFTYEQIACILRVLAQEAITSKNTPISALIDPVTKCWERFIEGPQIKGSISSNTLRGFNQIFTGNFSYAGSQARAKAVIEILNQAEQNNDFANILEKPAIDLLKQRQKDQIPIISDRNQVHDQGEAWRISYTSLDSINFKAFLTGELSSNFETALKIDDFNDKDLAIKLDSLDCDFLIKSSTLSSYIDLLKHSGLTSGQFKKKRLFIAFILNKPMLVQCSDLDTLESSLSQEDKAVSLDLSNLLAIMKNNCKTFKTSKNRMSQYLYRIF